MPTDVPPPPPTVVQTVTVTAARLPPSPGDAAFSIIRLTPAQIQDEPRIDDVIREVPGASLFRRTSSAAANPTTQGLSLRSIAPSGAGRALVTLDGVPQNDPFGGWVIWTSLPTQALEGASVVRGAGAGPYGAGALTGVVTLDELSRPDAVQAEASVGQLSNRRGAGAATTEIGGAELFGSGSIEHDGGWIPVRQGRGAADDKLTLDDWSLASRLQAPIGRALMAVRVGAYHEERSAGLVGAGSTASGQDASVTVTAQPEADQLGWRMQAWVRHSDLANSSVSVAAGRVSTTPANDEYATPAVGWGVNAALRGVKGGLTWETGADVRGAAGEDQELFSYSAAAHGFTKNRLAGGRTLVGGAYGEASYTTGPWLFTGGVRADAWASMGGHRIETSVATGAVTFQQDPADRSGVLPSARLAARRDLGDGFYVRAAGYSGFRAPTLNELYRPFRVGNNITEANADLKPEKLYGVEGAFGGVQGRLSWEATGFFNQLKDAVTNVTIGKGPGAFPAFPDAGFVPAGGILFQRQNAGTINGYGVEAEATYALFDWARLHAAGGYTHARVDGGSAAPQLTGLRPAQAPQWTASAGVDVTPVRQLRLSGVLRYESARFDDDQNTLRLAGATRVDLRADWSLWRGAGVFVAVDNLFDADIQTQRTADNIVSYDQPRMVSVGLTFRR